MEENLDKCINFLQESMNKKAKSLKNAEILHSFIEKVSTMLVMSDMKLRVSVLSYSKKCLFCGKFTVSFESAVHLLCNTDHVFCSVNCLKRYALLCTNNTLLELENVKCPTCRVLIEPQQINKAFGGNIEGIQQDACDRALNELLSEEEKELLQAKFSCEVCWNQFKVEEGITLECDHRFCYNCIKAHCDLLIDSAQVSEERLQCPSCPQVLSAYEIEDIVGPEMYGKYEKFRLRGLKLLPDDENSLLFYCRGTDCEFMCILDKSVTEFTCISCNYKCCVLCKNDIHAGKSCEEFGKWLKDNNEESLAFEKLLKREGLLRCPKCSAVVQRIDGCEFMICTSPECQGNTFFCYDCGKRLEFDHQVHECRPRNMPRPRNMFQPRGRMMRENQVHLRYVNRLGIHAEGVERLLGRPVWR